MHSNVNLEAMAGALAFLGTCLLLLGLGLVFVHGLLKRRRRGALAALSAGLAAAGLYGVLLLGFSLAVCEKLLEAGAEKYFCEMNCHLAYSVVGVRRGGRAGCPHRGTWAAPSKDRPRAGRMWGSDAGGRGLRLSE